MTIPPADAALLKQLADFKSRKMRGLEGMAVAYSDLLLDIADRLADRVEHLLGGGAIEPAGPEGRQGISDLITSGVETPLGEAGAAVSLPTPAVTDEQVEVAANAFLISWYGEKVNSEGHGWGPDDWKDEHLAEGARKAMRAALQAASAPRRTPTREEVARVIDPDAFEGNSDGLAYWQTPLGRHRASCQDSAFAKADAILALFAPPPATEGERP